MSETTSERRTSRSLRSARAAAQRIVVIPASIDLLSVLGPADEHLSLLESTLGVELSVRGHQVTVTGPAADIVRAERAFEEMFQIVRTGQSLGRDTVERVLGMVAADVSEKPADVLTHKVLHNRGRSIRAKTLNQKRYVEAIDQHTVAFGIGPAGTGKTYLAVAKAVQALTAGTVNRIVLTRPAVESGENLGFLPGTLTEKIDPYMRPLYDALHDMLDPDTIPGLMANGTIEIAPLAYMRGRTLSGAFIILDEAQNTTPEQMKMFLTRLGFGSKIVVTGDISQTDLPSGKQSGLRVIEGILGGIEDISFNHLTSADVVRHELVGQIVAAYDAHDESAVATAQTREQK